MAMRPRPIPPPSDDDVLLAKNGDKKAYYRVANQKSRMRKRQKEIEAWESANVPNARAKSPIPSSPPPSDNGDDDSHMSYDDDAMDYTPECDERYVLLPLSAFLVCPC